MKRYTVGIIGFGFIGRVHAYGHLNLPLFYDPPPCYTEITHICTSRPETAERGRQFRRRPGVGGRPMVRVHPVGKQVRGFSPAGEPVLHCLADGDQHIRAAHELLFHCPDRGAVHPRPLAEIVGAIVYPASYRQQLDQIGHQRQGSHGDHRRAGGLEPWQ